MAKIFIEETTLTAIGDAIREKEGSSALVPVNDMASRISAIQGGSDPVIEALEITSNGTYTATDCDGYSPITVNVPQDGAPTDEELTITGYCEYLFANERLDWFIEKYGNRITTKDLRNPTNMFYGTNVSRIPFELNFEPDTGYSSDCENMFRNANLTEIPKMSNLEVGRTRYMFQSMFYLRYFPEDFESYFNYSVMESSTSSSSFGQGQMFYGCYSLRKLPIGFLKHNPPKLTYNNSYFSYGFNECYSLDEAVNLPISGYTAAWTSNAFNNCFNNCYRLKRLTFETNADGTPLVMNWKGQTISLVTYFSYVNVNQTDRILNYNSGITADKQVKDAESYQRLKNDPDWWSTDYAYCRYNHDSAVETINSLPDTSAYGTNNIKFSGPCGSATDGGAINTLTAEEIAVATAKGWTVGIS